MISVTKDYLYHMTQHGIGIFQVLLNTVKICHLQHNNQLYCTSDQETRIQDTVTTVILRLFFNQEPSNYSYFTTAFQQFGNLRQEVCVDDRFYCVSNKPYYVNYLIFNNKFYRSGLNVTINLLLNSWKA